MDNTFYIDLTEYEEFQEDANDRLSMLFLQDSCRLIVRDTKSKLSTLLSDESIYSFLKEELEDSIWYNQDDDQEYAFKCQELLNYLNKTSKEKFYKKFNTVNIQGAAKDVIKYINSNPELKKFPIYYRSQDVPYKFDFEGLTNAINDFNVIKDETGCDVLFHIEENIDAYTVEEFKKALEIIDNIVTEIRKLDLSPLEKIIYVYDLIREKEYNEEDFYEKCTKSRDLISVLLGDKIVCSGFVKLFNIILKKLDISCAGFEIISDDPNDDDHIQTLIYIIDPKYKINGIYIFDPTAECKNDGYSYLESYIYFAKTSEEMQEFYHREKMYPKYKYLHKKKIKELKELLPSKIQLYNMSEFKLLKGVNCILNLIGENSLNFFKEYSKEELIAIYQQIYEYFNRPLKIESFIKAFVHVRSLEYYRDPLLYPFDYETIEEATFSNSFNKISINKKERDLLKVLGVKVSQAKRKIIRDIVKDNVDERKILGIKLTRQLRNKLNNG